MSEIKGIYKKKSVDWINKRKLLKQNKSKNSKNHNYYHYYNNFNMIFDHIDAHASKQKRFTYCDITGYQTNKREKFSNLYFKDSLVYQYIKNLPLNFKDEIKNMKSGTLL